MPSESNSSYTYLCLEKVGGDDLTSVAIEEGKGSGEGGGGNTPENGLRDDTPPARLRFVSSLVEEVVEEQRLKVAILLVGGGDVTKENTLDDASSTPHTSDTSVVQGPAKLVSIMSMKHEIQGKTSHTSLAVWRMSMKP